MEVVLTKSKKPGEKYDARIDGTKTVSFGQKGASDYTKHKNQIEKIGVYIYIYRERERHKKNEGWAKPGAKTAGSYSKHVLWNKPVLKESVDDMNKRFEGLNVKMKK